MYDLCAYIVGFFGYGRREKGRTAARTHYEDILFGYGGFSYLPYYVGAYAQMRPALRHGLEREKHTAYTDEKHLIRSLYCVYERINAVRLYGGKGCLQFTEHKCPAPLKGIFRHVLPPELLREAYKLGY